MAHGAAVEEPAKIESWRSVFVTAPDGLRLHVRSYGSALAPGLRSAARALTALGSGSLATARVLSGVANVAIAVAGFRYEAAADADEAMGMDPLALDPAVLDHGTRGSASPRGDRGPPGD